VTRLEKKVDELRVVLFDVWGQGEFMDPECLERVRSVMVELEETTSRACSEEVLTDLQIEWLERRLNPAN